MLRSVAHWVFHGLGCAQSFDILEGGFRRLVCRVPWEAHILFPSRCGARSISSRRRAGTLSGKSCLLDLQAHAIPQPFFEAQ